MSDSPDQPVSEAASANRQLEESQARLEGIVSSAMDAIITTGSDQRIIVFNAAAEKMFGCPAHEAIGSLIDRFVPVASRKNHATHMRNFAKTGVTSRSMGRLGTIFGLRLNGEEFPIEASISQIEIGTGKLFTVILRDISERQRIESDLAQERRQNIESISQRALQQAAVADLSRHALAGYDLDQLISDALALVAQILNVEYAQLAELSDDGKELWLRAGVGWKEGWVGATKVPTETKSQTGFTLLRNEPVVMEDLSRETRFEAPPLLSEHGVQSGASVVIQGRFRAYGALAAQSKSRRSYSPDDVHFLQSVSDVLATAIERRQLEEEVLSASAREQRRIGQDLHDGLCQHLAGVEFRTAALAGDLETGSTEQHEVIRIGELIRDATRQARMLARGLAPVELETNGLMSALTELAANSSRLFRVVCEFKCEQPVLITAEFLATQIYRIAQEAITNAVKHGRAKHIVISMQSVGGEIELTVTNDGAPLSTNLETAGGMGLRIMRYRAELIGAILHLGSTAEGKTELNCRFKTRQ